MNNIQAVLTEVPADFRREIPAGDYYVLPTTEVVVDGADWPVDWFGEETGPVHFEDGTVLDRADFDRYCAILDATDFEGNSHGFHYGLSLKRADEIDADALKFLLDRKIIAAHAVEEDSLLVFMDGIETPASLRVSDEAVFALVSESSIFDLYEPLQALEK